MRNWMIAFATQKGLLFKLGLIICSFWVIIMLLGPFIPDSYTIKTDDAARYAAPGADHFFGTDKHGRDIFWRVMAGAYITIPAALLTVILAFLTGVIFGGIAGYKGGIVDEVLMRFSELMLSMPPLILAMVIAAALGPSLINSVLAMVVIWWPNYARLMRSLVITLKETEYVTAARALGASHLRILLKEILPNSVGPMLVMATLDIGNSILMFSGLSFLGLGIQHPYPEWGLMVADGREQMAIQWWVSAFPGLAIFSLAAATNFVGDGIRDYLDPKLKKTV